MDIWNGTSMLKIPGQTSEHVRTNRGLHPPPQQAIQYSWLEVEGTVQEEVEEQIRKRWNGIENWDVLC